MSTIRVMIVPEEKSGVTRTEAPGERKEVRLGGWGLSRLRPPDRPELLAGLIGSFLRSGVG
jgi:hypothetical protein